MCTVSIEKSVKERERERNEYSIGDCEYSRHLLSINNRQIYQHTIYQEIVCLWNINCGKKDREYIHSKCVELNEFR